MAFEVYTLKKEENPRKSPNLVSIAVTKVGNKLNLGIVLGPQVLKTMNTLIGDSVELCFGTGDDKGKMLVKRIQEGGTKITLYAKQSKKAENERSGHIIRVVKPVKPIEDFCNETISRTICEHVWCSESGGLLVTLPEGFFIKEQTDATQE